MDSAAGITVTVVRSVVVGVGGLGLAVALGLFRLSGEALPPMIVSPEFPPDSGPPLTFSTNVTVAMPPAKITAAARLLRDPLQLNQSRHSSTKRLRRGVTYVGVSSIAGIVRTWTKSALMAR